MTLEARVVALAQACDNIGAASLVATGDLDRDFSAVYTAAKV